MHPSFFPDATAKPLTDAPTALSSVRFCSLSSFLKSLRERKACPATENLRGTSALPSRYAKTLRSPLKEYSVSSSLELSMINEYVKMLRHRFLLSPQNYFKEKVGRNSWFPMLGSAMV